MPVVDESPFPFAKPMALELVRVMAGIFRTEREAVTFTAPFGIDELDVPPGLSPIDLWYHLLRKLAVAGAVRRVVGATREKFPNNPHASFLDALLADRLAPVSAEPMPGEGTPGAVFNDSVTEPEALLFFDDLTIPVGHVVNLIATLTKVTAMAPAVCLLRVQNPFGSYFGTGFRIGERLILTNHHVLFPRDTVATSVQADFGFDVAADGAALAVTSLAGIVGTIKGEAQDDWAVIEVADMRPEWPKLPLEAAPAPQIGDLAYILQHPGGHQKRLGFVRNTISNVNDGVVRYLTDTEPGSSGAPVFDTAGRLIALHHAGGRPVEIAGKPPVAKNEGIRISRVAERLRSSGILA
ncbi:trypsin-like peptidase domain-containing protein [Bradyrhizobium sp.]|uniref:trypsin-like peptidase domain-containing protein n=1 Tax=Bradyrhizobium sp. TaxID=376 RepID=UPI001D5C5E03|nr:trypsin-like peptidase domain-containing protein [Bradyrhizobium sp.]MBI5320021.1 trypsin-like peptidase domain-containing protein [Bradyrhizobium sp.]